MASSRREVSLNWNIHSYLPGLRYLINYRPNQFAYYICTEIQFIELIKAVLTRQLIICSLTDWPAGQANVGRVYTSGPAQLGPRFDFLYGPSLLYLVM